MNEHTSPLTQRVRRLLGTGALQAELPPPPATGARVPDTGALFESQLSRLSAALRDLRTIDLQREAELRALRERLAIIDAVHQVAVAQQLAPALSRIDTMINEATHTLQPAADPPPAATLFERMRARAAARDSEQSHRETLMALATALVDLRAQLASLVEE